MKYTTLEERLNERFLKEEETEYEKIINKYLDRNTRKSKVSKYKNKKIDINDLELRELDVYTPGSLRLFVKDGYFTVRFPEKIKGDFDCSDLLLNSLIGCPKEITGTFDCTSNYLETLDGCPERVGKHFICSFNPLKSLKGSPKHVGGSFYAADTLINSLDGIPEIINGDCEIQHNKNLTNLKYAPKEVKGDFICFSCDLDNIDDLPKVKGKIKLDNNKRLNPNP